VPRLPSWLWRYGPDRPSWYERLAVWEDGLPRIVWVYVDRDWGVYPGGVVYVKARTYDVQVAWGGWSISASSPVRSLALVRAYLLVVPFRLFGWNLA
jgi:hypothetical protein